MESIEGIAAKIDELNIWDAAFKCNWAVRPKGCIYPYFCVTIAGCAPKVRFRFLMLDGWQTFHDYLRLHADKDWSFYLSPMEMPHYELAWLTDGSAKLYRHDPGYLPQAVTNPKAIEKCRKIIWESYGVMLRLESDPSLPMRYSNQQAMFMRQEVANGEWRDVPLELVQPRPHVEQIAISRVDVIKAKDLPMPKGLSLEVGMRIVSRLVTKEARPRMLYLFAAVDATTGEEWFRDQLAVDPEGGLRAMWENRAPVLLGHFLQRRQVPSQIVVDSGRMFRMLHPLAEELPFKLVKCTEIAKFNQAVKDLV